MRRNPERLAWTVTIIAFGVFCTLAVSVPLGINWYLSNATRAQEAKVTCLEGTAVVEDPRLAVPKPVLKGEYYTLARLMRLLHVPMPCTSREKQTGKKPWE